MERITEVESYKAELKGKEYSIVVSEIENYIVNEIGYMAKSNFRNIYGYGNTIEEAKAECEKLIVIKEKILSKKIKLIPIKEAEKLGKKYLINYIRSKNISKEIGKGLCSSSTTRGKEYIYYLEYNGYAHSDLQLSLANDLDSGRCELMLTVKVDREFSTVEIIEALGIKW